MGRPSVHVSVEGFDGVGKTTLCKRLARDMGLTFVEKPLRLLFDHDGQSRYLPIRDEVNSCPDRRFTSMFYGLGSLYLYGAFAGQRIVTDRHLLSNYAWSGTDDNAGVYDFLIAELGLPTITVVLYASKETIAKRLSLRDEKDKDIRRVSESEKIYGKMRGFIEKRGVPSIWVDTDGKDTEEVGDEVEKSIERIISDAGKRD